MTVAELLAFTPVPLRAQHNGWSESLQLRFLLALARGAGPGEAARSLGMTRQSAYRLRKRPGAESFAAAWDRAQEFARSVRRACCSPLAGHGGIESLLVPRFYRGRLVGFVQRDDVAGAMRLLGRLDRLAERLAGDPDPDALRERLEAFERLAGVGSYRSDGNPV
ncbi:MAG TPA: hypothetical protein VN231_09960 [Allosphingosinicella sp.]|nr:hypothetical protein [Allosphingosinicella sp.]